MATNTPPKKPDKTVDREVVSAGLDFRPLPLDIGDGMVWYFQPDPSPADWNVLTAALGAFAGLSNAGASEDEAVKAINLLPDLLAGLTDALALLLTDDEQRVAFKERAYGMAAQQRLAITLVEQVSGLPT